MKLKLDSIRRHHETTGWSRECLPRSRTYPNIYSDVARYYRCPTVDDFRTSQSPYSDNFFFSVKTVIETTFRLKLLPEWSKLNDLHHRFIEKKVIRIRAQANNRIHLAFALSIADHLFGMMFGSISRYHCWWMTTRSHSERRRMLLRTRKNSSMTLLVIAIRPMSMMMVINLVNHCISIDKLVDELRRYFSRPLSSPRQDWPFTAVHFITLVDFQTSIRHNVPSAVQSDGNSGLHAVRLVFQQLYRKLCCRCSTTLHGLLDGQKHNWKINGRPEMVELRRRQWKKPLGFWV